MVACEPKGGECLHDVVIVVGIKHFGAQFADQLRGTTDRLPVLGTQNGFVIDELIEPLRRKFHEGRGALI